MRPPHTAFARVSWRYARDSSPNRRRPAEDLRAGQPPSQPYPEHRVGGAHRPRPWRESPPWPRSPLWPRARPGPVGTAIRAHHPRVLGLRWGVFGCSGGGNRSQRSVHSSVPQTTVHCLPTRGMNRDASPGCPGARMCSGSVFYSLVFLNVTGEARMSRGARTADRVFVR